jgi:hypothetical protein
MASGGALVAVGGIIGTGAALSVEKIGWKPRAVILINVDDPAIAVHIEGMDDDSEFLHTDGTSSVETSGAITLTNDGFDLGTGADMNTDGEQVFYLAIG